MFVSFDTFSGSTTNFKKVCHKIQEVIQSHTYWQKSIAVAYVYDSTGSPVACLEI